MSRNMGKCVLMGIVLGVILGMPAAVTAGEGATPGRLAGIATDVRGAGIPGATIDLLGNRGRVMRKVTTDEAGRFLMREVAPGSYRLRAKAMGFLLQVTRRFQVRPAREQEFSLTLDVDGRLIDFSPPSTQSPPN